MKGDLDPSSQLTEESINILCTIIIINVSATGKKHIRHFISQTTITLNKRNNVMVLEGETLRPKVPEQLLKNSKVNVLIEPGPNDVSGPDPQGNLLADVTDCEKRTLSFMSTVHNIGTWNVRSLYAGKLEVVLHEIRRTNVEVLGIKINNVNLFNVTYLIDRKL